MPTPAKSYKPGGYGNVTPQLCFKDAKCGDAIDKYAEVFGATEDGKRQVWNGLCSHAVIQIGDSKIMVSDKWCDFVSDAPQDLFLYMEDVDAVIDKGRKAGFEVVQEPEDMFWGDRVGRMRDPYGHNWGVGTFKFVPTPEEMEEGAKKMKDELMK